MLKPALTIIRCEAHALRTTDGVRQDIERTITAYRRAVRGLAGVIQTHWTELGSLPAKGKCQAIESLFHATAKRPAVRYGALDRLMGKMPSYLRRAAIEAAYGVVSAFMRNYANWLDGEIGGKKREMGSSTPRMGFSNVFPPLYGGNMILVGTRELPVKKKIICAQDQMDFVGPRRIKKFLSDKHLAALAAKTLVTPHGSIRIKLLGAQGQWAFSAPLGMKGKPKRLGDLSAMALSPTLMLRGAKAWLSCPVELKPPVYPTNSSLIEKNGRVCSVDVGINTAAVAAIVDTTGTVIARRFFTCGRHNDQRDALSAAVSSRQRKTGPLRRGFAFCTALHRRIAGISLHSARSMAGRIMDFAREHGAKVLVVEDLKGWRPKGPNRAQRKRFHRFQHRMLIQHLGYKAQESGLRVLEIHARGTSRWAYDGSGMVKRGKDNAQLATFASGKQYNADLNGALNIAARGLAMILGIRPQDVKVIAETPKTDEKKETNAATGKKSGTVARMPLVLADIWTFTMIAKGSLELKAVSSKPSNRSPQATGVLA